MLERNTLMKKSKPEGTSNPQQIDLLNLNSDHIKLMVDIIKESIGPDAESMITDFDRKAEDGKHSRSFG